MESASISIRVAGMDSYASVLSEIVLRSYA